MTPDDFLGWADAIGPTTVTIAFLMTVVLPIVWRAFKAEDGGRQTAIDAALLRRDVDGLLKAVDDHETRLDALERPKRRGS